MDRGAFRGGFPTPLAQAVGDAAEDGSPCSAHPAADTGVLRGSRIKTLRGEIPVETLRPGDRVLTRDNGYQPLGWTGRAAQLPGRAVRLRKGALGRGMPERCLWIAPGQHLLIGDNRLRDAFDQPEVLVEAHHLTCLPGVALCAAPPLPLVQVRLDRHELILCEGTWCDSQPPAGSAVARPVPDGADLRAALRLLSVS